MGGYWPSIGFLRGRYVVPELRSMSITLSRLGTLVLSVMILSAIHHSPMLILLTCASINGAASYLQNTISIAHDNIAVRGDTTDDEEDGEGK